MRTTRFRRAVGGASRAEEREGRCAFRNYLPEKHLRP
jgi:hypothetical protein